LGKINPLNAKPMQKYHYSLFIGSKWYELQLKPELIPTGVDNPKQLLDVHLLNKYCAEPVFGIIDEVSDDRIDYVSGSEGIKEVVNRCKKDCVAGILLFPVSVNEVMNVADSGQTMPPKSTCFDPKPQTGAVVRIWK
jgi:uncharacterized protein (DUF1015 family)